MLLKATIFVVCPKRKKEVKTTRECAVCEDINYTTLRGPRNEVGFSLVCLNQKAKVRISVECPKTKTEVDVHVNCEKCATFKHVCLEGQLGLYVVCKQTEEANRGVVK